VMRHKRPDDQCLRLAACWTVKGCSRGAHKAVFPDQPFPRAAADSGTPPPGATISARADAYGAHPQVRRQSSRFSRGRALARRAVLIVETDGRTMCSRIPTCPTARRAACPYSICRPTAALQSGRSACSRTWHHQERHEVLEHRTAPRKENRFSPGGGEQAPQGEPGLLRQLSLRDRHGTCRVWLPKPADRSTRVPTAARLRCNRSSEMASLVVEEVVLHAGRSSRIAIARRVDRRNPFPCAPAYLREEPPELGRPLVLLESCQRPQGRDLPRARGSRRNTPLRRGRPGHWTLEGLRPPVSAPRASPP